jgi:glucose/arabinose dehydrogenase
MGAAQAQRDLPLDSITLPDGFSIELYAENVPDARAMVLSESGVLFVSTRVKEDGKVYAVVDEDKDGKAEKVHTLATGLHMPNGVELLDGDLYVAEVSKIWRFDDIEQHLDDPPKPTLLTEDLPTDDHHGWKFIAFGPDNRLYFNIGAPCNICNKEDENPNYASIVSIKPDGSDLQIFAKGVRNSVGITWHPDTKEMWFTDNGRDWLGDDRPPDELNHAPKSGLHFGFPFCHGGDLVDPEFGEGRSCDEFTAPVQNLGPHVAALGLEFYTGSQFPAEYNKQIFIAEHGSWNRSIPIGYRIMLVKLDENQKATSYEPFAEGWLSRNNAWGRPVDIELMPDGSMLVSDDHAGCIYRISHSGG